MKAEDASRHYADRDDREAQTAPGEVRAGLRRFLAEHTVASPILEIGTGIGGNLPDLNEAGPTFGIEISHGAAREAASLAPVAVADAGRLPFGDASMGTLVCTEVLEHVDELDRVLAEMARVIRPNGLAYVTTPNYSNLAGLHKWWADRRSGRHDWNPWGAHEGGYEAFMTGRRLWRAARPHFELVAVRGLDFGQAITGRFAVTDRIAWSRAGNAVIRKTLPRLARSTGAVAWHGMHIELTMRRLS
ncbi:MAG: class I SAM-dependent methyltransferase [Frankiaceae bacterium]|nr:class I SAM-dependent methyltransferase [Frankiaceae bacterium]MBV9871463.1 class I SAM-dependent methyltransferase [Frankiaceae bacterium]